MDFKTNTIIAVLIKEINVCFVCIQEMHNVLCGCIKAILVCIDTFFAIIFFSFIFCQKLTAVECSIETKKHRIIPLNKKDQKYQKL
jgi:hypothetical protein